MKKRQNFSIFPLIMVLFIILESSCKKDDTLQPVPAVTTSEITMITLTTARSGGTLTNSGTTVLGCGICWSTNENPTITNNKTNDVIGGGTFFSSITGLEPNTTYYVRAYVANSDSTFYGTTRSFTTMSQGKFTDPNDGIEYKTVTIGTQTWMAENLRTTMYNDGTAIPEVTDNDGWVALTTDAYCNLNNTTNVDTIATYGRLYNWYAVNTGKLCPTGWHVPTNSEWELLTNYLGDTSVAGGRLKETGTIHWNSPNTGATNETGFTALPVSTRGDNGLFYNFREGGGWWSATPYQEGATSGATLYFVIYNDNNVTKDYFYSWVGISVRCVKN